MPSAARQRGVSRHARSLEVSLLLQIARNPSIRSLRDHSGGTGGQSFGSLDARGLRSRTRGERRERVGLIHPHPVHAECRAPARGIEARRAEERRGGKGGVSTGSARGPRCYKKKK